MQFEPLEYKLRVGRLQQEMRDRRLDAALIDESEASAYLFGIDPHLTKYRAGMITASGEAFFVLRELDADAATWVGDIVGYSDWDDPVDVLLHKIRKAGLSNARIGIDLASHAMTVQTYHRLCQGLPRASFVDLDGLVWRMRLVKSEAELVKLRKAGEIADAAVSSIFAAARSGMTERDLNALACDAIIRNGGDEGFPGTVAVRKLAASGCPPGGARRAAVASQEVVNVEVISRHQGYAARIMRMMALGEVSDKLKSLTQKMCGLQDKQMRMIRPGVAAGEIDRILRDGALTAGIRKSYASVTGYTLGHYPDRAVRVSDFTRVFSPGADWTLEEGMVFHLCAAANGCGIGETVAVSVDGCERLTKLDRELFEAPLPAWCNWPGS
ncbi:aminopeptidase P family protein [Ensifer sp. ENS05]|uniref:M24 family metallopeptidase n=1 Tax=Ensifer sp. ENS05 TaxID=2769277 RepID=UPI001784F142|nr:Xaa-Pro peptidase family protein [Ensifer sp. ENS05]MBD9596892.1 aminopeptidase P family protein [Ensifer sp. ENS05]